METKIIVRADGTPAVVEVPTKTDYIPVVVAVVVLLGLLVVPFLVIPVTIFFLVSYNIHRGQP